MKQFARGSMPLRGLATKAITWFLFLEYLKAPGWAYGVFYTLLGIVLIGTLLQEIRAATKGDRLSADEIQTRLSKLEYEATWKSR